MFAFDADGNPTTYNTSTPANLAFDGEDRLTSAPTKTAGTFTATYDGDGLRATKTANGVTTFYLYDGGAPIIEETYSSPNASFSALYGWTADGWRARKQGTLCYQFVFDPQGAVVERQTDTAYSSGLSVYDRSTFEGFGALRQCNKGSGTGAITGQHDPAGFGGQFGYYTDTETGLLCLTHRYYDPGTGKFLTRDPIGYGGGVNLYGFADGNPVNESDPEGTQTSQTYGGVGHLLPDANAEYSNAYQQYTQTGHISEYGDNYHAMAKVGGSGPSFLEVVGKWFAKLFHSSGSPNPKMQRGFAALGRPTRGRQGKQWVFNPAVDVDLRGSSKGILDALNLAFLKTGQARSDFQVTKWGRDVYGKTHPVEWKGPNDAEVNIDFAHAAVNSGPPIPHVGYQYGKPKIVGHILMDDVPRGR